MIITNSLDFRETEKELDKQIRSIPSLRNRLDLHRLLMNIENDVHDLAKFEVELRRSPNKANMKRHDERVAKINENINHLEMQITFGLLL